MRLRGRRAPTQVGSKWTKVVLPPFASRWFAPLWRSPSRGPMEAVTNHADTGAGGEAARTIRVFLADAPLLVREGVRPLLSIESDLEVVGVAADFDELIAGATA